MARPCKSIKVLSDYSQTKSEIKEREVVENLLKGDDQKLTPPKNLNKEQKQIFKYIVGELKDSGMLGNLDIYILTTCCIAISRIKEIENMINLNIELLRDKNLMSAKDKYTKDLFRCCNELSLSPQSRAKLGNLNLKKEENPLLKALNGS